MKKTPIIVRLEPKMIVKLKELRTGKYPYLPSLIRKIIADKIEFETILKRIEGCFGEAEKKEVIFFKKEKERKNDTI